MLLSVGKLKSPRRIIAATGGGGGGGAGVSRSGTSDSDHVHTMSSLNTLFMIPNIHYLSMLGVNDNTENYSVKDINFTSGSNASHTFYLAVKGQNNTSTFHNDLCVGAIQIHTASAVVFAGGAEDTSIFTTTADHTPSNDPTVDPLPAAGGVGTFSTPFNPLGTGSVSWRSRSSTSSNETGAADSIDPGFQNTSNPLPNAGEEIIPQADPGTFGATNYIGTEATGLAINEFIYLKFTVSLATNTAHKFVFAYNLGVFAGDTGDDKDDNVGLFIEN